MFSNLDANRDGTLSATEINNSFFSRAFRDRDLSNGLSREQFAEEMQRMRERFGRGRGGDGDRRRDRGNDDRGDDSRSEDDRSRDGESGQPSDGSTGPAATSGAPSPVPSQRPRVTIDLQSDLLPGDSDRDGQLGLYEWRRFAGRSLREFQQLDLNRDGFVTPREYATVHPESMPVAVPAATAAVAAPAAQPAVSPSATTSANAEPATRPGNDTSDAQSPPANESMARDADRMFRMLDRNRDGQIVAGEWVDGRIRTMFTDGGIDLTQPLLADDFSQHYIRLSADE